MSRIDDCLAEDRSWCLKLGISSVADANEIIKNGGTDRLINISEAWQAQKISEIAQKIKESISRKKIILVSGPSSSGKTSFSRRLQLHLEVLGIHAVPISLDDYYIAIPDMPLDDEGKPDFESPESIDYKRFNADISALAEGKTAYLPKFDFDSKEHIPNGREIKLKDSEVIIAEGIHALNPKFACGIPDSGKYRIYCSALTALLSNDGVKIKSRTTRLIRRLIRDYYFRNSSCDFTFSLWPNQERGTQKYIFPYTDTADIIFNSSLLYEFGVYHRYLDVVFKDVKADNPNIGMINELRELTGAFEPIDRERTPHWSLIREFVGGSTLDI